MTTPAVSVVIACYNAASTLEAAVRSVLAQTLDATEVVLVDDASTDASPAIIDRLTRQDHRVRSLLLASNSGPAAARNRALEETKGRWVAVLDADDSFLPDRLQRLVTIAEAEGADLIADNQQVRDAKKGVDLGLLWHPDALSAIRWLDLAQFIRSNNLSANKRAGFGYLKPLMRRSFIEQHGLRYDPRLRIAEDYDCGLRCLLAGARWRIVPAAYYVYTIGRPSLSMRLRPETVEPLLNASRARLRQAGLPADIRRLLELHQDDLERSMTHAEFVRDVRTGAIGRACKRLYDHPDIILMAGQSVVEGMAKRLGLRRRGGKWIEPALKSR